MKTASQSGARATPGGGFTMVELALCIAVVAVGIVAIVGVLPAGINVQKNNREDTIIAADAAYWMEIVRNGSIGNGEITNYVDLIRVAELDKAAGERTNYFLGRNFRRAGLPLSIPPRARFDGVDGLVSATNIVGLMSIPSLENRYVNGNVFRLSNEVVAVVRSFNGTALDKPARPLAPNASPDDSANTNKFDTAFKYVLRTRITPFLAYSVNTPVIDPNHRYLERNLFDVQLVFEWPVFVVGGQLRTGNNRRIFHSQVSGHLDVVTTNIPPVWTVVPRLFRRDEHASLIQP